MDDIFEDKPERIERIDLGHDKFGYRIFIKNRKIAERFRMRDQQSRDAEAQKIFDEGKRINGL